MIEFALLFALGFLAAALLGLLIAPVIHRRIIRFAEERLKATMPLSPQEVRAQKDAARAVYAVENVKTGQALKRERDRGIALMIAREKTEQEARVLRSENGDLKAQLSEMNTEAGDLRSSIRQLEQHIERLKGSIDTTETAYAAKSQEASLLETQLHRVSLELDEVRLQVVAAASQGEALHDRAGTLREERDSLREELRRESERARAMELRLVQEDVRVKQLELRLTKATAGLAEKETMLARRTAEIDRLKARAGETVGDLRNAVRALRDAGLPVPMPGKRTAKAGKPVTDVQDGAVGSLPSLVRPSAVPPSEEVMRSDAVAFIDRLIDADPAEDAALRDDLIQIAAAMTALTVVQAGEVSPIPAILDREPPDGDKATLAARTRALIVSHKGS